MSVCQDLDPEDWLPHRLEVYVQQRCGIARIDVVALVNLLDCVDGRIVYVPSIKLCCDLCTLATLQPAAAAGASAAAAAGRV
jgi:hypothetical protein